MKDYKEPRMETVELNDEALEQVSGGELMEMVPSSGVNPLNNLDVLTNDCKAVIA